MGNSNSREKTLQIFHKFHNIRMILFHLKTWAKQWPLSGVLWKTTITCIQIILDIVVNCYLQVFFLPEKILGQWSCNSDMTGDELAATRKESHVSPSRDRHWAGARASPAYKWVQNQESKWMQELRKEEGNGILLHLSWPFCLYPFSTNDILTPLSKRQLPALRLAFFYCP